MRYGKLRDVNLWGHLVLGKKSVAVLRGLGLALALALADAPAGATLLTFQATHRVASSTVAGVGADDLLISTFIFDTAASDLDVDPRRGLFAIGPFALALPAWTVHSDNSPLRALIEVFAHEAEILNEHQMKIADEAFLTTGDCEPLGMALRLVFHASAFSNDRLFSDPPPLALYDAELSFYRHALAGGTIEAGELVGLVRVPEPMGLALFGIGLAAAALARAGFSSAAASRRPRP